MARLPSQESGSQALHHPVVRERTQRELSSDDLPIRDVPTLDTDDRSGDVIVASADMLNKDYADELAFMEEYVEVYLNRGREKHAPKFEQVGVNGQIIWIEVETPTRIKRKFLEVLARSMPMDIRTQSGEAPGDELTFNKVERSLSANFSFQVIRDPNPRGPAWLAKVRRES